LEQLGLGQPERPWRSGWRLGLGYVQAVRVSAAGLAEGSELPETSGSIFRDGATLCRSYVGMKNPPRGGTGGLTSCRADQSIQ
jgi:hypothetical protein